MTGIGCHGLPIDSGSLKVLQQDPTTPPFVGYLLKSGNSFSLASATQESGIESLYYTAELLAGHGVLAGDKILITDTDSGSAIYATVISVADNTITIDRPWDFAYPVTSICRKVSNDLAIDGSVVPQIFTARVGASPACVYGLNFYIACTGSPDDGMFGDIAALTNGVCLRVIDGYKKIIGCVKTNGELRAFGGSQNPYSDRGPAGVYSVNVYIPIRNEWGVPVKLSGEGRIQLIVQDDLRTLVEARASFVGKYACGDTM